jgi:hypothetical protein
MTLQPIPSEFPYTVYEKNFILFFISVVLLILSTHPRVRSCTS